MSILYLLFFVIKFSEQYWDFRASLIKTVVIPKFFLSTSIYDLVLIYVCHFHHYHQGTFLSNHGLSRCSCLHLGSLHPRILFQSFSGKISVIVDEMLFHLFHKNTKLRRLSTLHIVEGWLSLSLFFFLLMLPKRSFLLPSISSWKKFQKLTQHQQSNEACSYFFIGNILSSCQLLRYRLVINLWAGSIGGAYFNF